MMSKPELSEDILETQGWEDWSREVLEEDPGAANEDVLKRAKSAEKEYISRAERLEESLSELAEAVADEDVPQVESELEQLESEYERMVEDPYIDEDNEWILAAEEGGEPVGILHDTIRRGPELADRKLDRLNSLHARTKELIEEIGYDEGDGADDVTTPGTPGGTPPPGGEGPDGSDGDDSDDADDEGYWSTRRKVVAGALGLAGLGAVYAAGEYDRGGGAPPVNETTTTTTTSAPTTTETTTAEPTTTETTTATETTTPQTTTPGRDVSEVVMLDLDGDGKKEPYEGVQLTKVDDWALIDDETTHDNNYMQAVVEGQMGAEMDDILYVWDGEFGYFVDTETGEYEPLEFQNPGKIYRDISDGSWDGDTEA